MIFPSSLKNRRVVLGVTGGIAAYKAAYLVRLFRQAGAGVSVVMTQAATRFVCPLTFEALSENPVYTDMWKDNSQGKITHIALAKEADVVVVAPATANSIARFANGIADDALSTLMLAVTAPKLVAPSMNINMYENPATQTNLQTLARRGFCVLAPGIGFLACGDEGKGRMPDPEIILDRAAALITKKDLAGKRVLVTAGPTREYMDPVRFISNPSSGKMGFALARACEHRGADVTLVTGPVEMDDPINMSVIRVTTALEMARAVLDRASDQDLVFKAAAVSDYRPAAPAEQKIKDSRNTEVLELAPNPDILLELGRKKGRTVLVGFAAETQKLEEHSAQKMQKKNLDMIVGNIVGVPDSGFGADSNTVTCFYPDAPPDRLEPQSKDAVAHAVIDRAIAIYRKKGYE
jgi:phosphopantothenoylcysteine decarboxylase/phosphopantothenate--cysteine ligase